MHNRDIKAPTTTLDRFMTKDGHRKRKCRCGMPLDPDEDDECKYCKSLKGGHDG